MVLRLGNPDADSLLEALVKHPHMAPLYTDDTFLFCEYSLCPEERGLRSQLVQYHSAHNDGVSYSPALSNLGLPSEESTRKVSCVPI